MPWLTQSAILQQLIGVLNLPILHQADAELQIEKENKAAGTRARKSSLAIEKLLKEFRKASLEESKK